MQSRDIGFYYHVTFKKIKEYQKIPLKKRLAWLYQGNLLRMGYPKRIKQLQDRFRFGEI